MQMLFAARLKREDEDMSVKAVTCDAFVDSGEDGLRLCGEQARFAVSRSDGDASYGTHGGHEDCCEVHLAETIAVMLEGNDKLTAIVAVYWEDWER